ncbi:DUF4886 domain-containing protein [Algoriphagus resistens]|uniref:DUF4886 domain-containing protein n=1 Tax=Algoriphagus resistens TaxID=1750590 RepID=UPI0007169DEA|nr:DUF4886 domain-containing protein [Algoriphagus resistens]
MKLYIGKFRGVFFAFQVSVFLLFLSLFSHASTAQQSDSLRVLFIGNSYTYYWNLPQVVSKMAESRGEVVLSKKSTLGGSSLKQHWNSYRGLKSRKMVEDSSWDIVILQNHSRSTLDSLADFMNYGTKWIDWINKMNAAPILYMTWAREFNPMMQDAIANGYDSLAGQSGAKLSPVGLVWKQARTLRPDLDLFDSDGSHPSPIGTYLTACVLYRTITGNSVKGLPVRLTDIDKGGESFFLMALSAEDGEFIQDLVDAMMEEWEKQVDEN